MYNNSSSVLSERLRYYSSKYSSEGSDVLRRHRTYSSSDSTALAYNPKKYESKLEILPLKPVDWYSANKREPTSVQSPTYTRQTSFNFLTKARMSPPSSSYIFTSATENNSNDIVRPSIRARASSISRQNRELADTFSSRSSPSFSSRSSSMSPTYRNDRLRESFIPMSHDSSIGSQRSSTSSDIKASANKLPDKYQDVSHSTSVSFLIQSIHPTAKSRNSVSVDDQSCKGTSSTSSIVNGGVSSREPSPEYTTAMSYYSNSRDNGNCSYSRPRSDLTKRYSRTSSTPWGSGTDGDGTTGLKNIGNTCFMNSILQCLSNTRKLRDYCLTSEYLNELNHSSSMKGKLMKAFSEVIKDLWSGSSTSVTPTNFKSQIQKFSPRFMGYEQQDSQEFLRFLLEGLHEDINQVPNKSSQPMKDMTHKSPQEIARETWKWYAKKDKSFVFDLFVGQLESRLECLECGNVSLTYDPFWDLSLSISKSTFSLDSVSLDDCLRNFTKQEVLDRDEKPVCERCKTRRRMKKKLSIHRFPKILVIHLKRFNEGNRYRQKLSNLVVFPVHDKLKLMNYSSDTCEDKSSSTYDLYAVSNHCGSCYGGHYTAYCYNPVLREWYEYNDSRVSEVDESSVCTKEAYVLFYTQHTSHSGRNSIM